MTRLPVLAVAALLAWTNAAGATKIRFNGFCDGMQLQTADGINYTSTETGACLHHRSVVGAGKVAGNQLKLLVNWRPFTGSVDKKRYVLQIPFKTGSKFTEYAQRNGTWVLLNSGKYKVSK